MAYDNYCLDYLGSEHHCSRSRDLLHHPPQALSKAPRVLRLLGFLCGEVADIGFDLRQRPLCGGLLRCRIHSGLLPAGSCGGSAGRGLSPHAETRHEHLHRRSGAVLRFAGRVLDAGRGNICADHGSDLAVPVRIRVWFCVGLFGVVQEASRLPNLWGGGGVHVRHNYSGDHGKPIAVSWSLFEDTWNAGVHNRGLCVDLALQSTPTY